jgi:pimeloyl-ACP methyl ester carboxylesterase
MKADLAADNLPSRQFWVDVEDGRLYCEIYGNGPPLLLLHGWSLDHRAFQPQISGLLEQLTIIVFDRRGFGSSDAPPNLGLESADIDTVLDTVGLQSTHLLGMSQGGRIATRYAVARPDRVRSLVLQGAAIDGLSEAHSESEQIPIDEFVELAGLGRIDEVRARWLDHPMMRLESASIEAANLAREMIESYDGRDLMAFDPDSYSYPVDVFGELDKFSKPALLLTGSEETEARRRTAAKLLEQIGNSREIVLSGGGHLCNLTCPEDYNAAVLDFCLDAEKALRGSGSSALD